MEKPPQERRHTSQHALIDSAIRTTKQLAASSDMMTRSLANRMLSDLTLLRRGLPHRRLNEATSNASSAAVIHPETGAAGKAADPIAAPAVRSTAPAPSPAVPAQATTSVTAWNDTSAARDAIDSGEAEWPAILDLHRRRTQQRLKTHATILCFYGERGMEFNENAPAPFALHSLYSATPAQEPLGLIDAWIGSGAAQAGENAISSAVLGYERVAETAVKLPASRLVFVAQHAFDLSMFMQRSQALGAAADWLTGIPADSPLHADASLWERVCAGEELGESDFTLCSANGGAPRKIRARLWARRVEIPSGGDKLWATCLFGREVDAASDVAAREWRLVSNRSAQDLAGANELMTWWLSFGELENFTLLAQRSWNVDRGTPLTPPSAAAFNLINCCRIAQLTWHARANPESDANLFFASDEIRAIGLLTKQAPSDRPHLADSLELLARLGGMENWNHDVRAQHEAIRHGLRRLSDAVAMLQQLA